MAKGDFTDEEMAQFDYDVQRFGRFPGGGVVFDPVAESRGEPRWRKLTADESGTKATDRKAATNESKAE